MHFPRVDLFLFFRIQFLRNVPSTPNVNTENRSEDAQRRKASANLPGGRPEEAYRQRALSCGRPRNGPLTPVGRLATRHAGTPRRPELTRGKREDHRGNDLGHGAFERPRGGGRALGTLHAIRASRKKDKGTSGKIAKKRTRARADEKSVPEETEGKGEPESNPT